MLVTGLEALDESLAETVGVLLESQTTIKRCKLTKRHKLTTNRQTVTSETHDLTTKRCKMTTV